MESSVLDGVTGEFLKSFVSGTNEAWNWLQVDFGRVETAMRAVEVIKRKERETRFSVRHNGAESGSVGERFFGHLAK